MDFLVDLKTATEQNLVLFTSISPMMLKDNESIAIRPTPSSNETWRLDDGYTLNFGVQVLVKHQNPITAWQEINKIHDLWNGAKKEDLGISYMTIMEVNSGPNWVEKDDHNYHILTATYTASLEMRRNG